jgi:tyrosyl-tRNA synthetase
MSEARRDLVAALRERGLVHQVTDEALGPLSAREPVTAYIGFDPSAPTLHAGSLYPVMLLAQAARAGHRPIALLGGGTGLIGDPSGKDAERPLLDPSLAGANAAAMGRQIAGLFERAGVEGALILDNGAWLREERLVDFLRDAGKHFTVNWMMAKESVRARLEDREQGLSYTEFSYMLLQAWDFYRLWRDRGCRLQMGASDQWGNITAGIELIRRKGGGEAYGLTCPLLLTADGRKFGKSAGNAVWLDPALTSPYRFFQFWMHQEDAAASTLLAAYTFLPVEEVAALRAEAAAAPEKRVAQRRLASEVTALVHGREAAGRAERASRVLFGEGTVRELDATTLLEVFESAPGLRLPRASAAGTPYADLFCHESLRLCRSKGDYRRLRAQGALRVNDAPLEGEAVREADLLPGGLLVLRKGKREYALVRVEGGDVPK